MTIFQIIAFILANKAAIGELIKLIQDILASLKGDTAVALSEEAVAVMAAQYPALQSTLAVNGQSFMDLIKLIIEHREEIADLIKLIIGLFGNKGSN
jgi:hypothetical protein